MVVRRATTAEHSLQIDIQASHFSVTDALRRHAERRLRFALTFCDEHIQRIVMRLSDVNGPRGGPDKCCHLQVILIGYHDVVVDDVESDLYVAIDRAANRAARTVRRRLTRRRDRARTSALLDPHDVPIDSQPLD